MVYSMFGRKQLKYHVKLSLKALGEYNNYVIFRSPRTDCALVEYVNLRLVKNRANTLFNEGFYFFTEIYDSLTLLSCCILYLQ